MTQTYYNTNREEGETLQRSLDQAGKQDDRVLEFFREHPNGLFSREEVNRRVLPEAPYTSAQRSITNLTDRGYLEKTVIMAMGQWGKMVHTWRLKRGREIREIQ